MNKEILDIQILMDTETDFPVIYGGKSDEYLCYFQYENNTGKWIIYKEPIGKNKDWDYISKQCKKFGINPDDLFYNSSEILIWTEKKTG